MSDDTILRVLQGQSPDYWIYPNAAAFAAENLNPEDVARQLSELHQQGIVERELITIVTGYDSDDEPITDQIQGGYRLKGPDSGPADPVGI